MLCYFCKAPTQFFIRKNGYNLYRCPQCTLIQTDLGKPYDRFIKEFYTGGYFTGDDGAGAYKNYQKDKANIVKNMESVLMQIKKLKPNGKLLDIGCAYGYFVELAVRNGFDACGCDPSTYAVSHASPAIQKRIRHGTLSDISYKRQSFDAISMLDVFEHLADPVGNLKKVKTLLKDDGIVLIATGNTDSLAAKILKRRWTFYIPPQHLFFFNTKTISDILSASGFVPVMFFRIGKFLSLSYILHLAKTSGESSIASFLERIVEFLRIGYIPLYLPMGDNMVVIARKK